MNLFQNSEVICKKVWKKLAAFTQSESSIIVLVLCIFGMIVVPPLIKQQIVAANRTKVKKVTRIYEDFLQSLMLENNIKSEYTLNVWSEANKDNNCVALSDYFEIKNNEGCIFKTVDGIWWDMSDILNPIIAFNKDNLSSLIASSDKNRAFYIVVSYDSNIDSFRVNDLTYETKQADELKLKRVKKIYNFIHGIK